MSGSDQFRRVGGKTWHTRGSWWSSMVQLRRTGGSSHLGEMEDVAFQRLHAIGGASQLLATRAFELMWCLFVYFRQLFE